MIISSVPYLYALSWLHCFAEQKDSTKIAADDIILAGKYAYIYIYLFLCLYLYLHIYPYINRYINK